MKARDHKQLRETIGKYQFRVHTRETAMNVITALGLIGFGIMLVPILATRPVKLPVASTPAVTPAPVNAFAQVTLIGRAAVVYDLTTGTVLFQKNGEKQLPLASLTKLLTLYAATTSLSPNTTIHISPTALAQEGDSGLIESEKFALKDLGRLALVASSNDAAQAIAEAVATKESVSGRSMLASAAAAAGLTQTYANNGTGLDVNLNVSGGYGSALDIAHLAGKLLTTAPELARATIEPSVTVTSLDGRAHTLSNTNQDIVHLPNPLLSKTGFTDLAGGNLVVVFDAGINHPVAVVVLGSTREGRFSDVDTLVRDTLRHFATTPPTP